MTPVPGVLSGMSRKRSPAPGRPTNRPVHRPVKRPANTGTSLLRILAEQATLGLALETLDGQVLPGACAACDAALRDPACGTRATCVAHRCLILPLPPNLANGRMHWRTKLKGKNGYYGALDMLLMLHRIPAPPEVPWSKAQVYATLVVGNAMDEDNSVARLKWPLDWLVKRGYVKDDRRSALKWAAFPEQVVSRKRAPALLLVLINQTATKSSTRERDGSGDDGQD